MSASFKKNTSQSLEVVRCRCTCHIVRYLQFNLLQMMFFIHFVREWILCVSSNLIFPIDFCSVLGSNMLNRSALQSSTQKQQKSNVLKNGVLQSSIFKILQCISNYLEMSAFHKKNAYEFGRTFRWCSYDAFRGATKLICSSISKLISFISDISIDISFIPTNSYRNHWYGFRFRSFSKLPCFGDLKRCRLQSN